MVQGISGLTDDRVLPLERVHNFRDYGDYALVGGGRLKRGMLWRSGQHHGATDADLAHIAELNLAAVFDLRSLNERTLHPCRRPEGFHAAVNLIDDSAQGHAPHAEAAARERRLRTAEGTRENMRRSYQSIPWRRPLVTLMSRYIAWHADAFSGPSLINCMAGKDRTGISVAMLQMAAGVHQDDVLADYLLTNTAGDPEARIRSGGETIQHLTGTLEDDVLRVIMGVDASYLELAFAGMREQHGSIAGYLREMLDADDAMRARLRENLVAG